MSVVFALAAGLPAAADVILATSNNPTIALDARLNTLFGAERKAMSTMRPDKLSSLVNAPLPKGGVAAMTEGQIDALPDATGGKEWSCLSQALYFEARGESLKGVVGVAEVILNRVEDPQFPGTVCGVVNQGTGERFRCQFTYTCDGQPEVIHEETAFERVAKVARFMLDGAPRVLTDGATYYHTIRVHPRWSKTLDRTATIGMHAFYRPPEQMAQN